jgi:hypothetical protein
MHEYYSAVKRKSSDMCYMDELERVMLSEISQTQKDKYCMVALACKI